MIYKIHKITFIKITFYKAIIIILLNPRLPVDIYQTAKVVKLLIMMEKGIPVEHKGKSLSEIEIDLNEFIDEDNPGNFKIYIL